MKSRLFETLDQNDYEQARKRFGDYLKEAVLPALESGERPVPEIAYGLAGLLAPHFGQTLADDDPLMNIMVIAGELEIESENAEALGSEFITAIERALEDPSYTNL